MIFIQAFTNGREFVFFYALVKMASTIFYMIRIAQIRLKNINKALVVH